MERHDRPRAAACAHARLEIRPRSIAPDGSMTLRIVVSPANTATAFGGAADRVKTNPDRLSRAT
jgi:hypothetical protein